MEKCYLVHEGLYGTKYSRMDQVIYPLFAYSYHHGSWLYHVLFLFAFLLESWYSKLQKQLGQIFQVWIK